MREIEMNCNIYRTKENFSSSKLYDMAIELGGKTGDHYIDEEVFFNTFWKDLEYLGTASNEKFNDDGYYGSGCYIANINNTLYAFENGSAWTYSDFLSVMLDDEEPFDPVYLIIEKPNIRNKR